jgi:phage baseplate assembly protein W
MRKTLPRFLYGFLSASSEPINMRLPWQPSDRDGMFKMNYSVLDAERDNLIFWAHTNKGERVMDCEFGLDAHRYLFSPTELMIDNLTNNAREQLRKYFSHLMIEEISIITSDDDRTLDKNTVKFRLRAIPKFDKNSVIEIEEVIST